MRTVAIPRAPIVRLPTRAVAAPGVAPNMPLAAVRAYFDKYMPTPVYDKFNEHDGNTEAIIQQTCRTFANHGGQVYPAAEALRGNTDAETLQRIFDCCRADKEGGGWFGFKYKADPLGTQHVRRPAFFWSSKTGDCKSFSVFVLSCLNQLGIPGAFRFVSWKPGADYKHVYVVAYIGGRTVALDTAICNRLGYERPYHKHKDVTMSEARAMIAELGAAPAGTYDPIEKLIADGVTMTDGQFDLALADANLETSKAILEGIAGIGAEDIEDVTDTQEMLREAMYMAGLGGNAMDVWEEAYTSDMYNVAGIGKESNPNWERLTDAEKRAMCWKQRDVIRKLRRDLMAAQFRAGKGEISLQQADGVKMYQRGNLPQMAQQQGLRLNPEQSERFQAAWNRRLTDNSTKAALIGALDWAEADYNAELGKKKGKLKAALKKVTQAVKKTVKKVGQAIQRAAMLPSRVVLEGLLRTPAAAAFLYTYIPDAQARTMPAKVQKKRDRQIRLAKFIQNVTTMKPDHFQKLIRIGIKNTYRKEPEQLVRELAQYGKVRRGAVRGYDYDTPLLGIAPVVAAEAAPKLLELIKKIISLFKKKPDENPEEALSDGSDWEELSTAQEQQLNAVTSPTDMIISPAPGSDATSRPGGDTADGTSTDVAESGNTGSGERGILASIPKPVLIIGAGVGGFLLLKALKVF